MILIVIAVAGEHCAPTVDPSMEAADWQDVVVAIVGVLMWAGVLEFLTLSTR